MREDRAWEEEGKGRVRRGNDWPCAIGGKDREARLTCPTTKGEPLLYTLSGTRPSFYRSWITCRYVHIKERNHCCIGGYLDFPMYGLYYTMSSFSPNIKMAMLQLK